MMPGFAVLSSALLALLFIPLIVLYFLKLRREQVPVPSLVLWRQVLADQRVNSPFQKFKKHMLLLLQLLLLLMLILAAMQPYIRGFEGDFDKMPILIDHSASMGAYDYGGGETRLEAAKERVRKVIDGLKSNQQICLIGYAKSARKLTDFTNNKRVLFDALDRIKVWDVESGVEDALRMVNAMGQRHKFKRALMYTDGNVPGEVAMALSFKLDIHKLENGGQNVGVSTLSARRGNEGEWEVFAGLETNSKKTVAGDVKVYLDGKLVEESAVSLDSGGTERFAFSLPVVQKGVVKVEYKPMGFDSLKSDNVAYLQIQSPRKLRVGVKEEFFAWKKANESLGDVEMRVFGEGETMEGEYDLVFIEDGDDEGQLDADVVVVMDSYPSDCQEILVKGGGDEGDLPTAWQLQEELLRYVRFGDDAMFAKQVGYQEGKREEDLEERGYEVLLYGMKGPLILKRVSEAGVRFEMMFDMESSTLPYTAALPIMTWNLKQIAMKRAGLLEVSGDRTGVLPTISELDGEEKVVVMSPGGERLDGEVDAEGKMSGVRANFAGLYKLEGTKRKIGVSLLNASETQMEGVDQIQFDELVASTKDTQMRIDKPIWKWLAGLGLVLLLVEWWYFHKRAGAVRAAAVKV